MAEIRLNDLIGDEQAKKLAAARLHRVVAARLRKEGHDVSGDLDIHSAVRALGTNIFLKNAEYKRIAEGLASMAKLTGG